MPLLGIDFWLKTYFDVFSVLFALFFKLFDFVGLVDFFLFFEFFLFLQNVVEHGTIILVDFLRGSVELRFTGLFVSGFFEFGLFEFFHVFIELVAVDGFVELPDFSKFFLFLV